MSTATLSPPSALVPFLSLPDDMTVEACRELERRTDRKYHCFSGKVVHMPGGSTDHGGIAMNVAIELGSSLRGTNCRVFSSDVAIYLGPNSYCYPDLSVACGNLLITPDEQVQNPMLVVEVLSSSTRKTDLGDKLEQYKQIESLRHILYIEQDRPSVEHFARDETGAWVQRPAITDLAQFVTLDVAGRTLYLALSDVYRLVDFAEVQ